MKFKLAIITPALTIDHYTDRLFHAITALTFGGIEHVKIIVGPSCNQKLIPHGWFFLEEKKGTTGVFDAIDQAIDFAKQMCGASHFTWINCDDLLYPAFENVVAQSVKSSESIIVGRVDWLSDTGKRMGVIPNWPFRFLFKVLFCALKPPITQQGMIIPVIVYERLGGFNPLYRLIADSDLWYRAAVAGVRFCFVNKVVAGYTIRGGQLSGDRSSVNREESRWLVDDEFRSRSRSVLRFAICMMNIWNLPLLLRRFLTQKKWTACSAMEIGGFNRE